MQISCPGCKSKIQVPDERIKPTGTKVKCGKCEKVFTVRRKSAGTGSAGGPSKTAAPAAAKTPPPPPKDDSNPFDGDNFGAEMDNFKTQLRPMGGDRDDDLFGDSESLSQSPTRDDAADDLFGSADDLAPPEPDAPAPSPTEEALGEDPLDKFVADIRQTREEAAPEEPSQDRAPAAHDESLDDLFGKPMEDERDDFDGMLDERPGASTGPQESAEDIDALFDRSSETTEASEPASDKLDALFADEGEDPFSVDTTQETTESAPVPEPEPIPEPSPEEIGARMNLEPALKEEDAPETPVENKLPAPKARQRKSVSKRTVTFLLLVLVAGGGAGAFFTIPEARRAVEQLASQIPVDRVLALLPANRPPPIEARPRLSATVHDQGLHTGVRGDQIYIIEGRVRNDYDTARSFIKLRGYIRDEAGEIIGMREVFAGNQMSVHEIRSANRIRIDEVFNRSVGAGLSNFNVQPGESIPFQIVFYDVSAPIEGVEIEPLGSEPGS